MPNIGRTPESILGQYLPPYIPPPENVGKVKINKTSREEQQAKSRFREKDNRKMKISEGLRHNADTLWKCGINTSPKTGRNSIHNHDGIFTPKAIKEQIEYITKKQSQFMHNETSEGRYVRDRSSFAEKIIVTKLAKCLSEDFYFYLSNRYGDIRGGYNIIAVDQETQQTEFVIDVTLGKNDPDDPVNKTKIKETKQANCNGVIVYDGYKHNGTLYTPSTFLMTPLLLVSLPDKNSEGEDSLEKIVDQMSPSPKQPLKKDFENALYLVHRLIKSLHTLEEIHEKDLFNVPEIQKRTGILYRMLSPEEQSKWTSVRNTVHNAVQEWQHRLESLEDKLWDIEETLAEKTGIDPDIFWEMT